MAFISEIHYQNSYANQSGRDEFVEVALSPDDFLRASDFNLTTYQTDGTVRETFNLGDLTPIIDPDNGYYIYVIDTAVTAPDHTSSHNEAEAVALTDGSTVLTFVEINVPSGNRPDTSDITATEGPAAGATTTTIPPSPSGQTIQWDVYGNRVDGTLDEDSAIVCFADGTMIDTPLGPKPVESLKAGDLVLTAEGDARPLALVLSRSLSQLDLARHPKLRPIRIAKGAFSDGVPNADLEVSPQHRILISDPRMQLMFGEAEMLVAAKTIAAHSDKAHVVTDRPGVTYYHLVFKNHQIIRANGTPTESFFPGSEAIAALSNEARTELLTLFPTLDASTIPSGTAAAPVIKPAEAMVLLRSA